MTMFPIGGFLVLEKFLGYKTGKKLLERFTSQRSEDRLYNKFSKAKAFRKGRSEPRFRKKSV